MVKRVKSRLNDNKGISLLSLGIAILVMLIISSVLIYNSKNVINIKAFEDMKNDITQLDDRILIYYSKYGVIPKLQEYTNIDMIKETKNPNDEGLYYVIDINAIENLSLNLGKDFDKIAENPDLTDVYIINEKTHTIYYPRGVVIDGVTKYNL